MLHDYTEDTERLAGSILRQILQRLSEDRPHLGNTTISASVLDEHIGPTITDKGLGHEQALQLFTETIAPNTVATDHPAYLAYVPTAPTGVAVLFDALVSASGIIGSGWVDGGAAIWAENQALRWLAELAGLPTSAGGCFVSGGSAGTLSALVAARETARRRTGRGWSCNKVMLSSEAHSSVEVAARVMDAEILRVPVDRHGRLSGYELAGAFQQVNRHDVFAVVATAGSTNAGLIDDLSGVAQICGDFGVWLHVDAAYGGAALCADSTRERFAGIHQADSLIIDPHKWLFAPYDSCALLYARPEEAVPAFMEEASYLREANAIDEWNPMHYAFHLTRRPRGLPFWFSLAVHGTSAYAKAVEHTLSLTRKVAETVEATPYLDLVLTPELSVVLIRRRGWTEGDYREWCARQWREQRAFVETTDWWGEPVLRLCFLNPRTDFDLVTALLDRLA